MKTVPMHFGTVFICLIIRIFADYFEYNAEEGNTDRS